jgi:ubiquinone/menaquinone biosynthesis C-methylase UbiE
VKAIRETTADYFARSDVVSEYASFEFILWPERTILEELRPKLADARMLDVGVGAGRTTIHFAPLVREYVGVDLSQSMIDECRRRFAGTSWNVSFAVADVRDLRDFDSSSFDFVLFSFNGIDTVGGREDRTAALREIHRVCRPGAVFCFSSSNLHFALSRSSMLASLWMFLLSHPQIVVRHPRQLRKVLAESRRWKRLNPGRGVLATQGEGMIVEDRLRFEFAEEFYESPRDRIRVEKYYIKPRKQVDQLEAAGFGDVRVFRPDGHEVDEAGGRLARWWWLYYLCTKLAQPRHEADSGS